MEICPPKNQMTETVLITGGAGFIASHLIDQILRNTDWNIVILDKLTYAAVGGKRLHELGVLPHHPRVRFVEMDIATPELGVLDGIEPDYIVHMAAETHVDNSIRDPRPFIDSNVLGTYEMLEWARRLKSLKKFLYFSTDEVFGPAPEGVTFTEWSRYNSKNPYAATKAAAEELCLAWANSYHVPVTITHTMNVFGERQHVEKFIPRVIAYLQEGRTLDIHTNHEGVVGSRVYMHGSDVAQATTFVLRHGQVHEKYNIANGAEVCNLQVAEKIAAFVGKELNYRKVYPAETRPGFDIRYSVGGDKLKALGWEVPRDFDGKLKQTVDWYLANPAWLEE
jgi:dTDP-glucose 4,6-dehydratase